MKPLDPRCYHDIDEARQRCRKCGGEVPQDAPEVEGPVITSPDGRRLTSGKRTRAHVRMMITKHYTVYPLCECGWRGDEIKVSRVVHPSVWRDVSTRFHSAVTRHVQHCPALGRGRAEEVRSAAVEVRPHEVIIGKEAKGVIVDDPFHDALRRARDDAADRHITFMKPKKGDA